MWWWVSIECHGGGKGGGENLTSRTPIKTAAKIMYKPTKRQVVLKEMTVRMPPIKQTTRTVINE